MTGAADRPTAAALLLENVMRVLGDRVQAHHAFRGDATVLVGPDDRLEAARLLAQDAGLAFDMLVDSTAADRLPAEPRFEVVDHFFSSVHCHRLRLKCRPAGEPPSLPSLAPLYGSAIWMERETYDMYGIRFDGHPDLRRILLYPEFRGWPLRKDHGKLDSTPLFPPRFDGVRETSVIVHPRPGDQEPSREP